MTVSLLISHNLMHLVHGSSNFIFLPLGVTSSKRLHLCCAGKLVDEARDIVVRKLSVLDLYARYIC